MVVGWQQDSVDAALQLFGLVVVPGRRYWTMIWPLYSSAGALLKSNLKQTVAVYFLTWLAGNVARVIESPSTGTVFQLPMLMLRGSSTSL